MRRLLAVILTVLAIAGCGDSTPSNPAVVPSSSPAVANVTSKPTSATSLPESSPAAEAVATPAPTPSPSMTPAPLPPTGLLVANPKTKVKVPGATKIRYFKVSGTTPNQLLASTVARSKAKCHSSDTLACVLNARVVNYVTLTNRASGRCHVSSENVTLRSTVSMPVWTSPSKVSPALVTWWKAMTKHFAWHEGQHIKIQKRYDAKLKGLLVGKSCSSAKKIIKTWQRQLTAAQAMFDAKDRSWPYPEYTGS